MIRKLSALALLVGLAAIGYPNDAALAADIRIAGSDAVPTIAVQYGDDLVTNKPLIETTRADGTITRRYAAWVDRVDGKGFQIAGATTLKLSGYVAGSGYLYALVDAAAPPATPTPPAVAASGPLYGINVSGGEFKGVETGTLLPAPSDLDAYYKAGYRLDRIPFKAGQLDTALPKLVALANWCVSNRVPCIFDRHEYRDPPVADQVAFIVKFDSLMPKSEFVHLDTMNEPNGFTGNVFDTWAQQSQAIVTGVRAAGVTRRLWLEWPQSSGVVRFDKGERAPKVCSSVACALVKLPGGTIQDPLHLTGLEGHRYFDSDGSGTSSKCDVYVSILAFAKAAVPFGMPVMIGETALGNSVTGMSPTCAALAPSVFAEMKASPNLYGVTWWGGSAKNGAAFGPSYMFRTLPVATSPYIQMTTGR